MTEMVLRSWARESENVGGQEDELTLQGLAKRLETLERENAELRQELTALEGSHTRRDGEATYEPAVFEERVSRRALLSRAGAAVVAAMAAGAFLNPREAKAHTLNSPISPDNILTHWIWATNHVSASPAMRAEATTSGDWAEWGAVDGTNFGSGPGVRGTSESAAVEGIATGLSGIGVEGRAQGSGGTGVMGTGRYGVRGESNQAGFYGVFGRNTNDDGVGVRGISDTGVWGSSSRTGYSGVYGQHTGSSGYGVVGDGKGGSAGVLGRNSGGEGVRGEGRTGVSGVGSDDQQAGVKGEGPTGVWGLSSKTSYAGVYGEHTGTSGIGTVGIGKGGDAGVLGRNNTGVGVLGEGRNGIHGKSSGGYGGQFEGGRAQLRLVPAGSAGKPTSGTHQKGEIYLDSAGALFVCTAGDGTTVGTWKKVNMKLV